MVIIPFFKDSGVLGCPGERVLYFSLIFQCRDHVFVPFLMEVKPPGGAEKRGGKALWPTAYQKYRSAFNFARACPRVNVI